MPTEKKSGSNAAVRQAVILAGGKSSRFGTDKAFASVGGRPMLQIAADALTKAGFHPAVCTNNGEHAKFGLPLLRDSKPFEGPLAALGDIFARRRASKILLTACDAPFAPPELLERLWEESENCEITLLADREGKPSPLPGIYARSLLPLVRINLRAGKRDLKSLLGKGTAVHIIPWEEWSRFDPEGNTLRNINTPKDLTRFFRPLPFVEPPIDRHRNKVKDCHSDKKRHGRTGPGDRTSHQR